MARSPKDKSKVKNKNIRVNEWVQKRLGEMGTVSEDYGDMVKKL
jgi:hypothetical protein